MATKNSVITHKDKQGIGRITINRPEAYNALSLTCMRSLIGAFKLLSADLFRAHVKFPALKKTLPR